MIRREYSHPFDYGRFEEACKKASESMKWKRFEDDTINTTVEPNGRVVHDIEARGFSFWSLLYKGKIHAIRVDSGFTCSIYQGIVKDPAFNRFLSVFEENIK
jgi:hypothetical protein